jgi:hypothetical protein
MFETINLTTTTTTPEESSKEKKDFAFFSLGVEWVRGGRAFFWLENVTFSTLFVTEPSFWFLAWKTALPNMCGHSATAKRLQ